MTFAVSAAFRDACLVGGVQAFLDAGPGPAYLLLYGGVQPDPGAVWAPEPFATIIMTDPATTFVDHKLVFHQAQAGGDQIFIEGTATWGRLFTGDNVWVGDGSVSSAAGSGDIKIAGTDGTLLYAGARAILGVMRIG